MNVSGMTAIGQDNSTLGFETRNHDWGEMVPSHQKLTRESCLTVLSPALATVFVCWHCEQNNYKTITKIKTTNQSSSAINYKITVTFQIQTYVWDQVTSDQPKPNQPKPIINSPPALTVPFQTHPHPSTKSGLVTPSPPTLIYSIVLIQLIWGRIFHL